MSYRVLGVSGILLLYSAAGFGLVAIARHNQLWALLYGAALLGATLGILYSYCAKCPCRSGRCSHIFIGKLTALLPRRTPGPYRAPDHAGLLASLFAIVAVPQFWLWSRPALLAAFWLLAVSATLTVILGVCPHCRNVYCPMCGLRRRPRGSPVG